MAALLTAASSFLASDVSSWPRSQAVERRVSFPVVNLDDRYRTVFRMDEHDAYRRMAGLALRSGFEESWIHAPVAGEFYETGWGNEFKVFSNGLVTRFNSERALLEDLASSYDRLVSVHFHPSSSAVWSVAENYPVLEGDVGADSRSVAVANLDGIGDGDAGLDLGEQALREAFSSRPKAAPSLPDLTTLVHYSFLARRANSDIDYSHAVVSEYGVTRFRISEDAHITGEDSLESLFTDDYDLSLVGGRVSFEDKYFSISFTPFERPLPGGRMVTFYKDYLNNGQGTKPF